MTSRATESPISVHFERDLRAAVRGDVSFDAMTRGLHATDASHYQVMPGCVVWPRDAEDAAAAVRIAGRHDVPITGRGGGTSLSGQTTWTGMVLDFSRYMDRTLEVDADERWARVQPGVIRDRLNGELAAHRLHFAPDPATGNRCTVGGMIGNNSSGTRSVVYGKTIDHLLEATVVLADGTLLHCRPMSREQWHAVAAGEGREAAIYRGVEQVIERHGEEIDRRFPRVPRRVAGYNLDAFLPHRRGENPGMHPLFDPRPADQWNLADLIVGSEGTLGVLLEAKVRLTPLPKATALCAVHFDDLIASLHAVEPILAHEPSAVELLDDVILTEALRNRATRELADFVEGRPAGMLIVEFFGESDREARDRAERLARELRAQGVGYAWPVRSDVAGQLRVWDVRKLGLGLISNVKGPRKGQAFVEDACVPLRSLPAYIDRLLKLCERMNVPVATYAHASVGVLHVRPMLDLHQAEEVGRMRAIAEQAFEWVQQYGGAWAGEHGDGLVRGEFVSRFFGPQIYEAFREVKGLFDPRGLMNPGKIIDPPPMTENLRYGPGYRPGDVPALFRHRDQGGFQLAVEQCNGVGACRKIGSGTMCPSYMATRDEEHGTRGRANALRLAMSGQLGPDAMTGDRLYRVLELCLSCKACKGECPNAVDIARLKADFLQMYHDAHGPSLNARLIARMPTTAARVAGPLAPLANLLQRNGLVKRAMQRLAKVDARRSLPPYARRPFPRWFDRHEAPTDAGDRPTVVLFDDTYMKYLEPHVGVSAVELLESCGYRVMLAEAGCCQRPAISKGMLKYARPRGEQTLRRLDSYVRQGLPIVVCEPSCHSALTDDLPDLVADAALGDQVSGAVKLIDTFLAEELEAGRLARPLTSPVERVLLHGHCHQKALVGTAAMRTLLGAVEGLEVEEVDGGCCGMAGSFGYEHYDLSMRIGEDRLFPAVRKTDERTAICASGTSCRHQIHDGCGRTARHFVELLRGPVGR